MLDQQDALASDVDPGGGDGEVPVKHDRLRVRRQKLDVQLVPFPRGRAACTGGQAHAPGKDQKRSDDLHDVDALCDCSRLAHMPERCRYGSLPRRYNRVNCVPGHAMHAGEEPVGADSFYRSVRHSRDYPRQRA